MPYATGNELRERLCAEETAALTADAAGGDGAGLIDAALDDASAEIDAALAGRYAAPVDPAPPVLRRVCADLAAQFLFLRRREAVAPERLARAAEARALLARWASGELELEGAASRLRRLAGESTTRERRKTFDHDSMDSY